MIQEKSKGQWFRRVLAFFMAAMFLFSCQVMEGNLIPTVNAVTQAEIDALEAKAKEIADAQSELRVKLSSISNDKSNAVARKNLIEQEINLLNDEIANTEAQIALLDGLILRKVEEIQAAEEEERQQYALFCERVRAMEEAGEVSYLSILFQASSFSDLLDRIVMIDEIMEYDNYVMDTLIAIRESIIVEREELEGLRAEQQLIFLQQQDAKNEKLKQEAEVSKLIEEIAEQEAELKALDSQLQSAADSMDAEIKKKEAEMAAQIAAQIAAQQAAAAAAAAAQAQAQGGTSSGTTSGTTGSSSSSGYLWPLPAYSTLSSLFGGRTHPITGSADNHTGIDIPAPSGTPILSAKAGVVLISEWHYSYGNYVVVSHGDGVTTLYAHMVSRGVVEGQSVSQGQTVGYVGTTGSSTGNHLHFEVRINGTRYDPVNYYPDKTFYISSGGVTIALPR